MDQGHRWTDSAKIAKRRNLISDTNKQDNTQI